VVPRDTIERHFPRHHGKYRAGGKTQGTTRCRRSCHSKNRDHAGRCSASAPTGGASARPKTFSDATFAAAISTRGITYGSGSRRPAAAPGARSRAVAQNRAAELHLNPFLCIAAGTIAGFPREVIGLGQWHREQWTASRLSSSLRASWPMFVSA
jgi:hypothetical protein